ncbi:chitinase [Paenibacillus endophyticus]|uniref:chitinase n=1 Tax=Paenibacillus endophyticus TaxID=1294268 RepID=A0A7W5GDS3_9BACL|nr:glycosyl hydrolase family 18 protein [Paenibacillus endophyticus]MBB3156206.1 chitinase [Paenibacillus endophyticus]
MNDFARLKKTKRFVLLLCFALLFSSLFNASASYAADNDPPAIDPAAPQNLRIVQSSLTPTAVTLAWDINPNVNDIDVWDANTNEYLDFGNSGTRTLTTLKPNTAYRFYITWYERPATLAHKSNIVEFTTPDGEIVAPPASGARNLKVLEVTHNTVSLAWDPAPDIAHYWIWDENNKYITWANDGAQTVGGLTPETTYSFYVGPDGIQAPNLTPEQKSNLVTFTTLADVSEYKESPLAPPQNVKVSAVSGSSVTLSWTGSPGADGYDLYVDGAWKAGVWDGSNTITYTLPEQQTAAESVTFAVGAQNSVKKQVSENSNAVRLTWGELAAPQDVQVVTANRTTVSLGWAKAPGATSYEIYQDDVQVGVSDSNRYVAAGLQEGQSYSYKVIARNDLWESPASNAVTAVPGSDYNIVTYYTSWSVSPAGRHYLPTDVDVSQVTHINYAFADLCWKKYGTGANACENANVPLQNRYVYDGEIVIGDSEVDPDNFAAFAEMKQTNPHLKMMISVGGWTWSKNFSNMAATEEARRTFANSAVKFLREYELDGIDIDWEYPVEGGESYNVHRPEDKENFTLAMSTIREALDAAGSEDGKYYLLTIASGQGDSFVVNADLANASNYLDFINIMTYDYSGSWEMLAHHNAPLYADKNHPKEAAARNHVSGGALGHLNGGVPDYKLVLGIPYFGKGWSGCPEPGEYAACSTVPAGTWEAGIFDFTDLEENFVNTNGFVRHWNEASKVAYLYNSESQTFITYNDKTSMMYNASFVKSLNLAGVMNWDNSGDRNLTLSTQLVHDLPINGVVNSDALPAPDNLVLLSSNQNAISLQWSAAEHATGYEVFVNNQYAGYTTETKFTASSLAENTSYKLHVLAVVKDQDEILNVSAASKVLSATTLAAPSSGGSLPQPPSKSANELDASITKDGNKWTLDVQTDAAVKTIQASGSAAYHITISGEAKQIVVHVSKAIIEALAKKGEMPTLSVVWNGITYSIPVHAVHLSADIKISIAPPAASVIDQINSLAKSSGLQLLASPLDFKIEQLAADKTYVEMKDFGKHAFSRKYTLKAADMDAAQATGVVYLSESHEFRSVPTKITTNADGTAAVELIRNGNSIYAIVETNFSYKDVTAEWARKDVERAAAKLIASGESTDTFGVSSSITRAELVSMIVKGLGIMPDTSSHPFKDVDSSSKYAGDIAAAKMLGLIKGISADRFNPSGTITRQDLSVILANAWQYAGHVNVADPAVLQRFDDQASIASYAGASVALAVEQKVLLGVSPTTFSPLSKVTKAQAAVAVMRLLDALKLT